MEVSIVQLRSRRLWNIGANFNNFQIPSRTMTIPHVKRLAMVYQDLGNWSSRYFNVPGYSMVTSVVGFTVFNALNARANSVKRVQLDTEGRSIVIHFSNLRFLQGMKCVVFDEDGSFLLSEMVRVNECYSRDQRRFSVVVEVKNKGGNRGKMRVRFLWMIGSAVGLGGLCLVLVSMKVLKTQKFQVMERQADEDLVLESVWVGSSKMPSATVTRTQPTIERGGFP